MAQCGLAVRHVTQKVSQVATRAWRTFADHASQPHTHIAGLALVSLAVAPGSLLTGMVAYACLLHARIPLISLETLADRLVGPEAGGIRAMLGLLISAWGLLSSLSGLQGTLAFLGPAAQALMSLIPMLIGCMLARLAMEEPAQAGLPAVPQSP
jgi:hypothetical protein